MNPCKVCNCKVCNGEGGWWAKVMTNAKVDIAKGRVKSAATVERKFIQCPKCLGSGTAK